MEESNYEEYMQNITAATAKVVAALDKQIDLATDENIVFGLTKMRDDMAQYPPMFQQLLDNVGLVQGALADIGVNEFLRYANILLSVIKMEELNIIKGKTSAHLLAEVMKFSLLQGIKYGVALKEQDNELFSDFVDTL